MTDDGFTSAAEGRRLEAEADALLKADARHKGFIKPNGRGFSAYARDAGITTKKILETVFKHEAVGFTNEQLEQLAMDHGAGAKDLGSRIRRGDYAGRPRSRLRRMPAMDNVEHALGNREEEE